MISAFDDLYVQAALGIPLGHFPVKAVRRHIAHLKTPKNFMSFVADLEKLEEDLSPYMPEYYSKWCVVICLQLIVARKYCPMNLRNRLIEEHFMGRCTAVHAMFNYKY